MVLSDLEQAERGSLTQQIQGNQTNANDSKEKQYNPGHFDMIIVGMVILFTMLLAQRISMFELPTTDTSTIHQSTNLTSSNNTGEEAKSRPLFIFGHSTGHSGTGTFHSSLSEQGCPWDNHSVSIFENMVEGENVWPYDPNCTLTWNTLVPFILSSVVQNTSTMTSEEGDVTAQVHNTTYIDLGHFHNRGRTIECLAKYFGEQAGFVHIRRNRYSIARSFIGAKRFKKKTPCTMDYHMYGEETERTFEKNGRNMTLNTTKIRPTVAICPRSGENAGPVDLPVENDAIWDTFTPFQRFLWYADEVEHRWHTLQQISYDEEIRERNVQGRARGRPSFFEVTWNNPEELSAGIQKLRNIFGCSPLSKINHEHEHRTHSQNNLNCSEDIRQDLEYRRKMKYDTETLKILVSSRFPQHVDSPECENSPEDLEKAIELYSAGIAFHDSEWVLPSFDNVP